MDKKDYGLVFAGGGGKGAYQIGVYKALKFLKMDTWIKGVSGDSVGALNAILFANGDYEKAEDVWKRIHPIQFLDIQPEGVCSRDGLLRILDKEIDLSFVSNSSIHTYVTIARCPQTTADVVKLDAAVACVTQETEWEGEYHLINGKTPDEIRQLLLATTAMPIVYEPVKIGENYYRDGGLFDNMPMRPLLEEGIKNLILVKLNSTSEYDVLLASQAEDLIEITPSGDIGHLLDGTLDFDSSNVSYRLYMGFYDTIRTFEFYERRMLGFPVSASEKAMRIEEDLKKVRANANAANVMKDVNRNTKMFEDIFNRFK